MDKKRKAGDRLNAFKAGSSELTPVGQSALDMVSDLSGKESTVHFTPKEIHGSGVLGYVDHKTPDKIFLDPKEGDVHTLAHEAIHSQMPTAVGQAQMQNRIKHRSNFSPTDVDVMDVPKESGARLRYLHEKIAVPVMLEEAAAQGGARGVTDALGLKDQDRGFRMRNSEGVMPDEIYKNADGSVDQLAYPLVYRDQAVDEYTRKYGTTFQGEPLGIGVDPRFSEAEREVYYDIANKSRARAQRMFDNYRNKFK